MSDFKWQHFRGKIILGYFIKKDLSSLIPSYIDR